MHSYRMNKIILIIHFFATELIGIIVGAVIGGLIALVLAVICCGFLVLCLIGGVCKLAS